MAAYFGYGAMIDTEVIAAVIGRVPNGQPATLPGMALCIQTLDQIPSIAQELLRKKWPADFRSYSIVPMLNSKVSGMLWTISDEEREMILDWELTDLGWYEESTVTVLTKDGRNAPATTEVMKGMQRYSLASNSEMYLALLNDKGLVLSIANTVRLSR